MAGVPNIMQVMLDAVTPRLKTGKKMHSVAIDLHRPEGDDRRDVRRASEAAIPTCRWAATRPSDDNRPCTQLVLRSIDEEMLHSAADGLRDRLAALGLL